MRARRPLFVLLLAGVGCISEYHPEYHPVSSYTYVQNVTYSTTVIDSVAPLPRTLERALPKALGSRSAVASAPGFVSTMGADVAAPPRRPKASLPLVETRMALADGMRLKEAGYARFAARLAEDPQGVESALKPLDAYGGKGFDVRRDPANPKLAIVRFNVWSTNARPGATVIVTASTHDGAPVLSCGKVDGGEEQDDTTRAGGEAIAMAHVH